MPNVRDRVDVSCVPVGFGSEDQHYIKPDSATSPHCVSKGYHLPISVPAGDRPVSITVEHLSIYAWRTY